MNTPMTEGAELPAVNEHTYTVHKLIVLNRNRHLLTVTSHMEALKLTATTHAQIES